MKSIVFLILILLIPSAYSAYISKAEYDSGNIKTFHLKKCGDCLTLPKGVLIENITVIDEMIDDPASPIYEAKSNAVACSSEEDCLEKEAIHVCDTENKYFTVRLADNTEVYCTKLLGYNQVLSGREVIIEDPVKKSLFVSKDLKRKSREARKRKGSLARQKCKDALDYIAGGNLDSELTEEQVDAMQAAFSDIFQALQANRPGKALRLIKLVTDPTYEDFKNNIIEILE